MDGVYTRLVNDGQNVVAQYVDGRASHFYRGSSLIGYTNSTGDINFYQFNAHGDVVSILDCFGNTVRSYDYDAFGKQKDDSVSNFGSYKYTATMHNLEFNEKIKHWYNECGIIGEVYPLLVLNSSDYIDAIKRQTYHAFPDSYKNLKHYVFITFDAVIEVVSPKEPSCVVGLNI